MLIFEQIALQLATSGYNVLPVQRDKRPVGVRDYEQYYDEHMSPDFVKNALRNAKDKITGLALLGRVNPWFPEKMLVIIDVDDPDKLSNEAREILKSTWHWLTGVRCPKDGEKHDIRCVNHNCKHGDHEFDFENAKRGEAFAILVPTKCVEIKEGTKKLLGGAIELRVRGYQLLPPSIHPSGIKYEWVNSPFQSIANMSYIQPPLELNCEEWRRILSEVGYYEMSKIEIERGPVGARKCVKEKPLADEQIDKIIELLEPTYIPGHRDYVVFSITSLLWRLCVDYPSAYKLVERLIERKGDEEAKARTYVVNWVYGKGEEKRRWGRAKFVETFTEIYKTLGMLEGDAKAKALELLQFIYDVIGIKQKRVLVPVSYRGKESGKNAIIWIANHRSVGIVRVVKHLPPQYQFMTACKEYVEELCSQEKLTNGCDEPKRICRDEQFLRKYGDEILRKTATYGYDFILPNWYISKANALYDIISGLTYYNVELSPTKGKKRVRIRYATIDDVVERLRQLLSTPRITHSLKIEFQALLNSLARPKPTYVVAGVVLDENKPRIVMHGPYATYLKQLFNTNGDLNAFYELIKKWYFDDSRIWDAFALALFQAFNFVRKQAGLRNKWLALVGEPGTGKSTIARTVSTIVYNMPGETSIAESVIRSPGVLFSPARLARSLQYTTLPIVIDEGGTMSLMSPAIADTIKRAVNGMTVYEIASANRMSMTSFPAYAGVIITTQSLAIRDPGLVDRLHVITFTIRDKRVNHDEFLRWLTANRQNLAAFGATYIRTAVEEWDKVCDMILAEDYVDGARRYLAYVLSKIGKTPRFERIISQEHVEDELERLVSWVIERAGNKVDFGDMEFDFVANALKDNKLAPYITATFTQDDIMLNISAKLVRDLGLTSLRNLAEKINSELGEEIARNVIYYGRYFVRIPLAKFMELVKRFYSIG